MSKPIDYLLNVNLRLVFEKIGLIKIKRRFRRYSNAFLEEYVPADEVKRLRQLPGFQATNTVLLGHNVAIADSYSYLSMVEEIFVKENYKFKTTSSVPYIVDCGSNIGLSVLYFKRLYPNAEIVAIEADPNIFKILQKNVELNSFSQVRCENAAVWPREELLTFVADGSWGGHLDRIQDSNEGKSFQVTGFDIKKVLNKKTDFLKIDIEGAETEVLMDARELIVSNVDHLFFEWHSICNKKQKLGEILNFFENNGFRYHIKEASERIAPFSNVRAEGMDSQLDCFLYKEEK